MVCNRDGKYIRLTPDPDCNCIINLLSVILCVIEVECNKGGKYIRLKPDPDCNCIINLLHVILCVIEMDRDFFRNYHKGIGGAENSSTLRALYYPPLPEIGESFILMTFQVCLRTKSWQIVKNVSGIMNGNLCHVKLSDLADLDGGLEVCNRGGKYIGLTPDPDCNCIINLLSVILCVIEMECNKGGKYIRLKPGPDCNCIINLLSVYILCVIEVVCNRDGKYIGLKPGPDYNCIINLLSVILYGCNRDDGKYIRLTPGPDCNCIINLLSVILCVIEVVCNRGGKYIRLTPDPDCNCIINLLSVILDGKYIRWTPGPDCNCIINLLSVILYVCNRDGKYIRLTPGPDCNCIINLLSVYILGGKYIRLTPDPDCNCIINLLSVYILLKPDPDCNCIINLLSVILLVCNRDGKYIRLKPDPDCICMIVGNVLQRFTSDKLLATKHRVLVPEDEVLKQRARQSVAFFIHHDNEIIIQCLDGSDVYETISAVDYLEWKFNQLFKMNPGKLTGGGKA
ncbi:hypothetical protein LOTGIDRAFT_154531 [Lottia gigantea]|uniref:Isopenicillin N synthase-like Fe(2+) 2OG dioxygenase domain-containing protein n=1 Tax=Lottia gigantea TaxID=225164 RepID=V4A182_LOTGI|nr:hypothetical protein LOTGIDRAFT_154531 [Lottia gigantea]ESO87046.1 hypothetical protein LOTGIDRAFT_154531 [Lottia gigantea]